ncbi:hypothetical protein OIU77_025743 [Salix suchowensis]|uniref:Uncharacterized protein n=1 Tax=Salix suchowensis TaxID=1278906 RepID=A0ABQ9BXA1_9ROSI|nr:hypothetical protein OIU77_025743 [Salix suchowensis]
MASSKVLTSSKPRNSDLSSTTSSRSRRATSSSATNTTAKPAYQSTDRLFQKESTMTVDGILRNVYASPSTESTLLDAQITLMESPDLLPHPQIETDDTDDQDMSDVIPQENKTADDIWREIVVGRKEMKDEPDEMMTLEDFLAKAGAVDVVGEDGDEVKMPPPERMSGGIAYQVELESLAVRLEEENEQLLKAKDSLYNQLVCDLSFVVMEIVVSSYCIISLLIHCYLHPFLVLLSRDVSAATKHVNSDL